jgi:hypothetical protein
MTSKLTRQTKDAGKLEIFPDFPPRDDMQNSLHLDDQGHQGILRQHLGHSSTTIVLSEIPVRRIPSQQEGHRIPDLLVAFGVDRALAIEQKGYSIRDQGKPPDFVLEIASATTGREDYIGKRNDYAAFGIREYWRFDPSGGRHHDTRLAGDRLVAGAYQSIQIEEVGPGHHHGHSDALNLDPCWDNGQLRWWDPITERHLLTLDEKDEALSNAEARANSEQEARIAAEARVRELEAELRKREQS